MKNIKLEKLELRNVLTSNGDANIVVELVPFNRRNDDHVDFALAYADMLGRMPSEFRNMSDAAVRAVELFVVHKEEDANNAESDFSYVRADKRAARTVLNSMALQKALADFFENA